MRIIVPTLYFQKSCNLLQGETEDEYLTSCLLMVFVAVSIPKLARSDSSMYQAHLEVGFSSLLVSQRRFSFQSTTLSTPFWWR
jgi:hypothetical protein